MSLLVNPIQVVIRDLQYQNCAIRYHQPLPFAAAPAARPCQSTYPEPSAMKFIAVIVAPGAMQGCMQNAHPKPSASHSLPSLLLQGPWKRASRPVPAAKHHFVALSGVPPCMTVWGMDTARQWVHASGTDEKIGDASCNQAYDNLLAGCAI